MKGLQGLKHTIAGVVDQAVSSLTNLGVAVAAAHALNVREFGAFTLAFSTYLVAVNVSRAITTEPLTVRYSNSSEAVWRGAASGAAGAAAAIGIAAGVLLMLAALVVGGEVRVAFLLLGVTMPALLVQDGWRFALFAAGRATSAVTNDCVWAATFALVLAAQYSDGAVSLGDVLLGWTAGGVVSAAFGAVQVGAVPKLGGAAQWWRQHRPLAARFLAESMAAVGSAQLALYAVAAVAGLTAVGGLRAAQLLLGPLTVLFMGVGLAALPVAVRLSDSPTALRKFCRLLGLSLAGAALACGAITALLPSEAGSVLLGESWGEARAAVFPFACALAGSGLMAGAFVAMRALAAATRSLRVRVALAPLTVLGTTFGAVLGGAPGAAVGLASASWVGAALAWREANTALLEASQSARAPDTHRVPAIQSAAVAEG